MSDDPYTTFPPQTPVHVYLADILRVGMSDAYIRTERHQDHSLVFTNICDEPIKVLRDDIDLPDPLKSWSSAILLDVRAFLAENPHLVR